MIYYVSFILIYLYTVSDSKCMTVFFHFPLIFYFLLFPTVYLWRVIIFSLIYATSASIVNLWVVHVISKGSIWFGLVRFGFLFHLYISTSLQSVLCDCCMLKVPLFPLALALALTLLSQDYMKTQTVFIFSFPSFHIARDRIK